MNALEKKLVDKLSHYHDTAPVYRIESPSLDELEVSAGRLAKRAAGQNEDCKSHIMRGEGRSDVLLSDGIRARVYHPSGAIAVKAGWAGEKGAGGAKGGGGGAVGRGGGPVDGV